MKSIDVLLCALVTGVLLCLTHGYTPFLGALATVPLLMGLKHAGSRQAFYAGLLCGLVESAILLGTLHYHGSIFVGIALLYGFQRSLFAVGFVLLGRKQSPTLNTLLAPTLWVTLELLNSGLYLTLPNILGDTQHVGFFLPFASLGGSYLISFVLVWASAVLAELAWERVFEHTTSRRVVLAMLLWVVVVGFLGVGSFFATQPGESVAKTAVIVQGGYPMWVNEAANESASRWEGIPLRIYQKLTQNAVPGDLTLWPEAPFGQRWGESLELEGVISKLVMERSIYLMGLIRTNGEGYLFNSAFVFDGEAIQFKDKQRLILHEEGDFSPGKNPALFDTSIGKLGAVFCFESVVPSYTRELVQGGAQVIAVLANGTKLGRTPVARLHAQRSVLRAVETGRWVLHSGHHGFSMIVSPQGITTTPTAPYESAVVSGIFYLTQGKTPYMILGDKPLYIWLLFFLGYLCLSLFLKGWASR